MAQHCLRIIRESQSEERGLGVLPGDPLQPGILRDQRIATLKHVVGDLFPSGGDLSAADPWTGLRPMTPDGTPILSRKMWEMMQSNRMPPAQLPLRIGVSALPGYGWGLGVRVMMDTGQAVGLTSVGEFGWAGAAKTYFWVDPAEDLVGVFMSQYMTGMEGPDRDFRSAVYQAIVD